MKNLKHVLPILLTISGVLGGCASAFNPGGTTDYACPGMPMGVICKTPSTVYAETRHRNTALSADVGNVAQQKPPLPAEARLLNDAVAAPTSRSTQQQAPANVMASQLGGSIGVPKPVLEPAVVLRIWIAPYVGEKGDLKYPSYTFTEITPRRWSFGESAAKETRVIAPLQIEQREPGNFVSAPSGSDDETAPKQPPTRNMNPMRTGNPNEPSVTPR